VSREQGRAFTVDIVITNHNYGAFVSEAVDSACGQTHPNVNVVVVDDGSTDDSRERLRPYEDAVEIILKKNGGQASALNAGIARCSGDLLLLLDADDRLRPHAAERVAEAFARDPGLAKVQFRMGVVDAAGRSTGWTKPFGHYRAPAGDLRRAELSFPFDLQWLPGGGTAFRADAVQRILPIPESDYPRWGADWYLVHLTALLGTVAALDEVCADYRIHGGNAYEPQDVRLDLERVRAAITYARATSAALGRLADELGLDRPDRILSLADLANRLTSLKLERAAHPVPDDRASRLVVDAVRAAGRRFDVSLPMKTLFVVWFAALAASPPALAPYLAELFLFPQRRQGLDRLLGRLQRPVS
jgi:glycosyltransferase involved in cell wall biosynthesis